MKYASPALLLLLLASPARGAPVPGETAAVLSASSGAFLEAFAAFRTEYGAEVPRYDLSKGKPALAAEVKTVVTFGSKAAALDYPSGVNVVYAMAPALVLPPGTRQGRTVKVSMLPEFGALLAQFKLVQPSLKKLAVFWMADSYKPLLPVFAAAGAHAGIEIIPLKADQISDIPRLLRSAMAAMDAFWVPPDPLLLTPNTLMIFKEFSWENKVPMYASTRGLAREGAIAAVGISFAEMGAAAAAAARGLNDGAAVPETVYPLKIELTLNTAAARQCEVTLSPEVLRRADHTFP